MPSVPGTAFGGATDPSSIQIVEGFRFIPSIQVTEQYDSNVFYGSKSQLRGLTPEDFITTVAPQVRGLFADHKRLVRVNAVAGAVGSYYVNNTGLSYVGANAGAVLDMSDLLSQWRPGARWTVTDTFTYTPQPPAFLVGDQSGQQANTLLTGFQATRSKTTFNSINTMFELPLSTTVNVSGSYTNSFIRYGASQVPQAATLIGQDIHVYTAGVIVKASIQDSVKVDFTGSEFDSEGQGAFNARGGTLGWIHRFSPTVSFNAAGGAQLLSGQSNGVPFSVIAPIGNLAIL